MNFEKYALPGGMDFMPIWQKIKVKKTVKTVENRGKSDQAKKSKKADSPRKFSTEKSFSVLAFHL